MGDIFWVDEFPNQLDLLLIASFSSASFPTFPYIMALYDNNDMNLEEIDLEVFEIDAAILRELLEEDQEGKDDKDHGKVECMVESVEENDAHPDMMNREQEQQQQQNCLEKYGCHDFEWLNMMEPTNPLNDVKMNWFSDDIVGMVDFGYANEECYSQICDGLVSNEASYGFLWEDYDI
ncbi:hypothetical protein JHK82_038666 [Glycine max]|nr:hypothetical protein JHK86_038842 [Glycine max]KAG4964444.1 hypothetical protein JHK85_039419 [Glycine max]KAG5109443.1 hypothetical protein JHK82_038666 [Glycine max]